MTPPPTDQAADSADDEWSGGMDMDALASRIQALQEADVVQNRLESLPCAWVLVFDADTEDEAVYSMELVSQPDEHVVLAFEDRSEAESYALSLTVSDPLDVAGYDSVASVQGLDVEALVVTSRDADFKVGVVFRGDLLTDASEINSTSGGGSGPASSKPLITGGISALEALFPRPPSVSISITMVPDTCFAESSADDFLDPSEDPVWVLVHDAGTGDESLFSMSLNGTASVICFKDEEAAARCSAALTLKGTAQAAAQALYLEELLERVEEEDLEICLVDEVVENFIGDVTGDATAGAEGEVLPRIIASDVDDDAILGVSALGNTQSGLTGASGDTSVFPPTVRQMLEGLWDGASADGEDGEAPPDAGGSSGTAANP